MGRKARQRVSRAYPIDLAFDPTEPRDAHGRWGHGGGVATLEHAAEATLDAEDFEHQQTMAQHRATAHWAQETGEMDFYSSASDVLMMERSPLKSWATYALDGGYQAINGQLRHGDPGPRFGVMNPKDGLKEPASELAEDMVKAFETMGYTTKEPGTLFRMVDADKVPIGDEGSTFIDKGVSSTAALTDDIASLLDTPQQGQASLDTSNPVLLQIRVPAGTRVLGGAFGGIETMLAPGTKYKVVSKPTGTVTIGGEWPDPSVPPTGKHSLPTVILEVVP